MMHELATREDLQWLRRQLLADIKTMLEKAPPETGEKKWLRSREVRQLLHISANTLLQLRSSGRLPYTKMGSIHYYSSTVIHKLLEEGFIK